MINTQRSSILLHSPGFSLSCDQLIMQHVQQIMETEHLQIEIVLIK